MRLPVLVSCWALLGTASPVSAQVSVIGIRDLAFGPVIVGIDTHVAPSDPVRSGQFRITARAGTRVRLDFTLPGQLNGPGGASMLIKFSNNDGIAVGTAPGSVAVSLNPKSVAFFPMGGSTAAQVFIGGTVSPTANQAVGGYIGTITLTVALQ